MHVQVLLITVWRGPEKKEKRHDCSKNFFTSRGAMAPHEAESTYALEIVIGRVRSNALTVSPCVAVRLLDFPTLVMRCEKQPSGGSVCFDQG